MSTMDDLFGDDFNTSVPAINPMESTPAVSLEGQLSDVVDGSLCSSMMGQAELGGDLKPVTDPAESFITKEKVRFFLINKNTSPSIDYDQEQLGDLGLDLGIGEPAPPESQPAGLLGGGDGGGLLGDSLGDVQAEDKKIDNTMPVIEDVIEDDNNGGLNLPKIEEDSSQQNDLGNITLISSRPRDLNTEPQCLVEWRKKQEERIKLKDEEEARKKNELREKARQELEAWYKKYEEEVRMKKEENRLSEEAFLADVHGLKPGTEWERVARNCGFNSKVVHCKKDRARLRNVILSLKQETLLNRN